MRPIEASRLLYLACVVISSAAAIHTGSPPRPQRPHCPPVVRPMTPAEAAVRPYVSGINRDWDGRPTGFHVVAPGVDVNPFGGLQQTVDGIRKVETGGAVQTPPPVETVHVFHYKLAPPSAVEAERKEQAELETRLAKPETLVQTVAFAPAVFAKNALPLVKAFYREKGEELVPAFDISVSDGTVVRTERPDAVGLPVATEPRIRAAYEAGTVFRIVREHPVPLTCGMCGGSGKIPVERVVVEGREGEKIVEGDCPRCGGKGKNPHAVECIFDIRKPAPKGE